MLEIIKREQKKHPMLNDIDILKLLFQATLGPKHLYSIERGNASLYMDRELSQLFPNNEPIVYEIGKEYVRINLYPYINNGFNKSLLLDAFLQSSKDNKDNSLLIEALNEYFNPAFISEYVSEGIRPVSHSEGYHQAYHPQYRVINKRFLPELNIISFKQFHLPNEWSNYIADLLAHLEEICTREEYEEYVNYIKSNEYYVRINSIMNSDDNRFGLNKIIYQNKVIGFLDYICYIEEGKGIIGNFYIYPSYRNLGLGTICYQMVEDRLRLYGANHIDITPNKDAIGFYLRKGFYQTNEKNEENSIIIYRKEL